MQRCRAVKLAAHAHVCRGAPPRPILALARAPSLLASRQPQRTDGQLQRARLLAGPHLLCARPLLLAAAAAGAITRSAVRSASRRPQQHRCCTGVASAHVDELQPRVVLSQHQHVAEFAPLVRRQARARRQQARQPAVQRLHAGVADVAGGRVAARDHRHILALAPAGQTAAGAAGSSREQGRAAAAVAVRQAASAGVQRRGTCSLHAGAVLSCLCSCMRLTAGRVARHACR